MLNNRLSVQHIAVISLAFVGGTCAIVGASLHAYGLPVPDFIQEPTGGSVFCLSLLATQRREREV